MAKTIYHEWFVKFRFLGHEKVKIVESELGRIPEEWAIRTLKEVAGINELSIKKGQEPSEIMYVTISAVYEGQVLNIEQMPFSKAPGRARRIVRHGDIIWSAVRPNLRAYSLILNPQLNLIVSTGFAVITPTKVPFSYLYETLTTDEFVDYLVNHTRGAAYPAVNTEDFENAKILVPNEQLLNSYHQIVSDFFTLRQSLIEKNVNLRQTRDLLLPKLISGELDVENLESTLGRRSREREK